MLLINFMKVVLALIAILWGIYTLRALRGGCSTMRFVEQKTRIETAKVVGEEGGMESRHGPLLPGNIRAVICGPSGVGKTHSIISLLLSKNGLKFRNIYIFSKSLAQPKYIFLEKLFAGTPEIGFHVFSNNQDIPTPDQIEDFSIMIFDDIACEKQEVVKQYFSIGRHFNIDSFYLCQTYSQIPKHLVRDNLNLIILFQQDTLNMHNLWKSHINSDMNFKTFQFMCQQCWQKKYGFLLVNKDVGVNSGRYRFGFNCFILPAGGQSFLSYDPEL